MSSVSKYLINGSSVVGYSTLTTDGNGNGTWFDLRTISYTNKSAKYYSLVKSGNSSTISYSTITNGLYYLKNNSTGTYIAVAEGKDANGQAVNLWNKSESFRVQITKDTNGYVMRFPGVSSTRVVNQYASAPVSGTKVTLYTYSGSTSQSWGFQKVSGGYVIRSMYNQNLCLTGNGSSVATVTTYTGTSNQIWTLESYCTHSSTTTKNAKSATCTATGYTGDKYCSSCGVLVSYGSTIAKLGHSTSVVNKKSATCTSTGYTGDTYCSRCKTTVSKGSTIAKLGHSTSVINKKSATCTQTGYTGDTYCSTCKTTISKGSTIAKTAHKTTVVNAKSATCTSTGYSGDTKCTVCSTVTAKGTVVKATGHKEVVISAVAPTLTTVGKTEGKKCSVCGTVIVAQKNVAKLTLATPTVTIANTSNGVKVTWTTVANATGYRVYSSTYNTKTKKWSGWTNRGTAAANRTTWTDTKAKSGTYYKYTVRAVNGSALSSYNKTGVKTLYLSQPTVKIANNASGMKVTWNKITGATGYTVYRSEYVNGAWSGWKNMGTIKNGSTVSWVDKSVKSGTQYRYTVRTVNGSYKSTYKASSGLLYLAQPKTTVKAVSTGITVNWTQSAGATGFTVYRSEYNAKTKKWSGWKNMGTAKADKKSWTDKSAKKGVTYRYTVKAVNGKTASTYKASANVKR